MSVRKSITFALGGGGVKCYAHLGVLKVFEQHGWEIKGIAATSAAALIAALYAKGDSPDEIIQKFSNLDFMQLSRRSRQDRQALFGLSNWRRFFEREFGDLTFAALSIPIAFPSVDLESKQECVLSEGRIVDAVMAAVAIPGLFPPQQTGGSLRIDGGVLNPIPVALARSLAPGVPTVAVALMPPIEQWAQHPFPQLLDSVPFLKFLSGLRYTQALLGFVQASDLTNRRLAELRMQVEKPNWIIRPEVNHLGLFDAVNVQSTMHAGERTALDLLAKIKDA